MANGESVEVTNTPLGSFKISSASLNTLATLITFILVCLIAYVLASHNTEAKESNKEVAKELREANKEVAQVLKESNKELSKVLNDLARATRIRNCLDEFPPQKRAENSELCKRLSQ